MKTKRTRNQLPATLLTAVVVLLLNPGTMLAVTNVFFDISQTTNLLASGTTSDTIGTEGYSFSLTRDKLFTGGVGLTNPIGRSLRVFWPEGSEAQAVTAGPNPGGAKITLKRQDGERFAIKTFKFKLLANTAGAGAMLEVMPMLNGEDGLPNPIMYNATGYYGQNFTNYTPELTGFDAYKMTLYVDYALMNLTMVDPSLPPPALGLFPVDGAAIELSWPTNAVGYSLESATNLPVATWSTVTNSVVTNGDLFTVRVETTELQRFYRLRK